MTDNSTSAARSQRQTWLLALAVCAVAFALRISLIGGSIDRKWPHSVWFEGDAPVWVRFAQAIQRGTPFEFDLPFRNPGVAYLLALLWSGNLAAGFANLKILWAAMGAATAGAVVLAARPVFGLRVGVLGGLLTAVAFSHAVQSTAISNEVPYTLLIVAIIAASQHAAGRPAPALAALLGVLHALALLLRAEHTLFLVGSLAGLTWAWTRRSVSGPASARMIGLQLALVLAIYFLIPLPWNIRCARATHRFNNVEPLPVVFDQARPAWTPDAQAFLRGLPAFAREGNFRFISFLAGQRGLGSVDRAFVEQFFRDMGYVPRPLNEVVFVRGQGALNFALANNEYANGGFSTRLLDPNAPADFAFGNPRHLRLYQEGYSIGLAYLRDHPAAAARLMANKLERFAAGIGSGIGPRNAPLGLTGTRYAVDQFVSDRPLTRSWITAAGVLITIGVGVALWRRTGAQWIVFLAYKLLITLAFFGYARQGASTLPLASVFVALAIDAALLRPMLRRLPALASRQALAAALLSAAALLGMTLTPAPRHSRVVGGVDPAPQWGAGAFESSQTLRIESP